MSNESKNETKSKTEAPKTGATTENNAAAHNPFAAFGAVDPSAFLNAWQNPAAAWTAAQAAFQTQMSAAQNAVQQAMDAMTKWATPGANPMAAWTSTQASFQKAFADSFTRAQAWSDEYAANEAQMTSRAHAAVDTWAQLAHDSINYTAQLSAQARKLSMDAARKAGFAGA